MVEDEVDEDDYDAFLSWQFEKRRDTDDDDDDDTRNADDRISSDNFTGTTTDLPNLAIVVAHTRRVAALKVVERSIDFDCSQVAAL